MLVQAWPRPERGDTSGRPPPDCSQQSLLHPSPCTCVITERPWSLLRAQGGCAAKPGCGSWLGRALYRVFSSHQPRCRAGAQDGEALPMGALLTGPAAHRPRSTPPLPVPSSRPTAAERPGADAEKAQHCPSLCFSPGLDLPSAESDQVLGEAAAALQLPEGSCAGQAGD